MEPGGSAPLGDVDGEEARVLPLRRRESKLGTSTPPSNTDAPSTAPSTRRFTWRRRAQCRWCAIGDQHRDVLDQVHHDHVVHGLGAIALMRTARRRLESRGESVPSLRGLSRHLQLHVERVVPAEDDDPVDVPTESSKAKTTYVPAEWRELWSLFRRIERQLQHLDGALAVVGDDGHADLNRIGQVTGLSNAARSMLETITKTRDAANINTAIAQHSIKTALLKYTDAAIELLRGIADDADAGGAHDLALRVRSISTPMLDAMVAIGKSTLDEVLVAFEIERTNVTQ